MAAVVAVVLVVVAAVALVVWSPWSSDPDDTDAGQQPRSESGDTPGDDGPVAPLTGLPVESAEAERLLRPALVAKVDGAAAAMPQAGLGSADIVIEVRVEGISRLLAVWHSQEVGEIGPVRSARTTDPDLLASYGTPLFSYSGGNSAVLRELRRSDRFTDVSHDAVPGAYSRSRDRRAPHDLMADSAELWDRAPDEPAVPPAQFTYLAGEAAATGQPAQGFAVAVGSDARFAWDEEAGSWRRWAHGSPQEDPDGEPLHFGNVVVLEVDYVTSAADPQSPEAVSVGSGRAWAYTEATVREGTWSRPDRTSAWNLTDGSGAGMPLEPGTTWVVLSDREPLPLGDAEVSGLLDPG